MPLNAVVGPARGTGSSSMGFDAFGDIKLASVLSTPRETDDGLEEDGRVEREF